MGRCKAAYHHGNLRQVLIDSALEILKNGSLQDLSLRALARKAGVSQTAPYRHFKDKDALIAVLKQEGFVKLAEGMGKALEGVDDQVDRIRKIGLAYVEFAQKYTAHFKMMFEFVLSPDRDYPEMEEEAECSYTLFNQEVSKCLDLSGNKRISHEIAGVTGWAIVHGLSMLMLNGPLERKLGSAEKANEVIGKVLDFYSHILVGDIKE